MAAAVAWRQLKSRGEPICSLVLAICQIFRLVRDIVDECVDLKRVSKEGFPALSEAIERSGARSEARSANF
jgi:histone H3/H4